MRAVFGAVVGAHPADDRPAPAGHAVMRGLSPASDGSALRRTPSGKPMNNLELVEKLCEASVPLREARRVHVQSFGALIPHVFMAAVLARVGKCLVMGSSHAIEHHREEIESIVAALEQGMRTGDRETRNVIAISFVSDSELELFFDELKQWLGPTTLKQVSGK